MAWCRQAPNHYLSQCWPTSLSPYGVTRPEWVKVCAMCFRFVLSKFCGYGVQIYMKNSSYTAFTEKLSFLLTHPWHMSSTMGFLVDDKQALVNMLWNLGLVTDQCKCVKEMFSYVLQTQTADQKIWFLKDVIIFFLKLHLRHFPLNIVKLTRVSIVAQTMHANDTKMNQMTPTLKGGGHFSLFIHVYEIVFSVMGLKWSMFSNTYSKPWVTVA